MNETPDLPEELVALRESIDAFREGRVGANFVIRSVSADSLKACAESLAAGLAGQGHTVTPGGI